MHPCFWGGIFHRPTPQPHHGSDPPELWTKQNLFSSQTTQNRCFITVTQHGRTDSKRQRKGWSVSSLSHLAIFENLLVVRGSLPSSGVHGRWEDDWQNSTGRVTCSRASCGNEEVDTHKQFTFSFFSFSFSTQKSETTHEGKLPVYEVSTASWRPWRWKQVGKGRKKNLEVTQRSAKMASYHSHLGFCITWMLATLPESEFLVSRFKFNLSGVLGEFIGDFLLPSSWPIYRFLLATHQLCLATSLNIPS